ncbi:hypothetical protein C0J52_24124 [Blattella germanica]|nr:hypothetical protein C0J52_24124 [Blattella germanica]
MVVALSFRAAQSKEAGIRTLVALDDQGVLCSSFIILDCLFGTADERNNFLDILLLSQDVGGQTITLIQHQGGKKAHKGQCSVDMLLESHEVGMKTLVMLDEQGVLCSSFIILDCLFGTADERNNFLDILLLSQDVGGQTITLIQHQGGKKAHKGQCSVDMLLESHEVGMKTLVMLDEQGGKVPC